MDGFRYEDGNRWTKDKCTLCQCKVSMRELNGQVLTNVKDELNEEKHPS